MDKKLIRIFEKLEGSDERNVAIVIARRPIQIINVIMKDQDIERLVDKLKEKYYLSISMNDSKDGLVIGIKNNRVIKCVK